jgi:hypothetical protein
MLTFTTAHTNPASDSLSVKEILVLFYGYSSLRKRLVQIPAWWLIIWLCHSPIYGWCSRLQYTMWYDDYVITNSLQTCLIVLEGAMIQQYSICQSWHFRGNRKSGPWSSNIVRILAARPPNWVYLILLYKLAIFFLLLACMGRLFDVASNFC